MSGWKKKLIEHNEMTTFNVLYIKIAIIILFLIKSKNIFSFIFHKSNIKIEMSQNPRKYIASERSVQK